MQGRKRFFLALLCLVVLLTVLPLPAFAEEGESGYRVVIDDEADLLTAGEELLLRSVMAKVLPYGNAAFLSTDRNPYGNSKTYIENRYTEIFGDSPGVVMLIDMDLRYIQLSSQGAARKKITSTRCNEITDNIYSYASKQQYAICATKAFEQVIKVLDGGRVAAPFRYVTNAFLSICLALLGNFALMSLQRRKKVAPENALTVQVAVDAASAAVKTGAVAAVALTLLNQRKTKHVESSGGGRSGGGGGFSGGGGHSGGGFSGGGHRF